MSFFHSEQEAKIKGEYSDLKGKTPKDIRMLKAMKRIHQYEKFVENCERYKQFEQSKKATGILRSSSTKHSKTMGPTIIKSKSFPVFNPGDFHTMKPSPSSLACIHELWVHKSKVYADPKKVNLKILSQMC